MDSKIILRPRPWPAYFLMVVGLFFILFSLQKGNENFPWIIGIAFFLFPLLLLLLLRKAVIILTEEGIEYRTLFSTKKILWSSLTRVSFTYAMYGQSGSYDWHFETASGTTKISTTLYSRRSHKMIAGAVIQQGKIAFANDRVHAMAQGHFPFYHL